MKKSSLFISAALTAFILAILAGAFTAVRAFGSNNGTNNALIQQVAPVSQTIPNAITPEQAAQVAASTLGRNDLYSVETSSVNGIPTYKITFSSGDIAYVDMNGQFLGIVAASPSIQQFSPAPSIYSGEHESSGDHD